MHVSLVVSYVQLLARCNGEMARVGFLAAAGLSMDEKVGVVGQSCSGGSEF